jgi:hypothetical protein
LRKEEDKIYMLLQYKIKGSNNFQYEIHLNNFKKIALKQ